MTYQVLDIVTNQPIPGAYLYRGLKSSPVFSVFTDAEGFADVPGSEPVSTAMIGYKDLIHTGPGPIYLEPVAYELPGVTITADRPSPWAAYALLLGLAYFAFKK